MNLMTRGYFAAAAGLLLFTRVAGGCSCGPAPVPLKALAQADAVFSAKIIKIEESTIRHGTGWEAVDMPVKLVTAKVIERIKGDLSETITLWTGLGFGDCGLDFEKEQSYLIYAYKQSGMLYTDGCSRTALLSDTGEEILELERRLPVLKGQPRPPVLELKCGIDDAGYNGLVFTLRNRLHERIFFFGWEFNVTLVQVWEKGKWVDYPPNYGERPRTDSAAESERKPGEWKQLYRSFGASQMTYLDRMGTAVLFVAPPTNKRVWRVGVQYLTEEEVNAGQRVQDSKHYIWSAPVDPKAQVRNLPFHKAFQRDE